MSFNWSDYVIMIVEDDKDMQQTLCELLRKKGAKIYSADNGQAALEVLEKHQIDFVISDVQMPIMDGVELLKKIKERNPEIPIVLLATGQALITAEIAESKGAAGLIQKPFTSKALLERVQNLLQTTLKR